jgi:uncharacterized protein (DUF1697 family)
LTCFGYVYVGWTCSCFASLRDSVRVLRFAEASITPSATTDQARIPLDSKLATRGLSEDRKEVSMSSKQKIQVGLLRGINVAGQKKVPMAELRELATSIGLGDVKTYIQSGNLVFHSGLSESKTAAALESAIAEHFGFEVEVVVCSGVKWLGYAAKSPFPDAEEERPKTLLLGVSKSGPSKDAVETVMGYAVNERAAVLAGALWIDFVDGSGKSKIRPAVLQRALGPSATTRNWRTVQTLGDMVRELKAA